MRCFASPYLPDLAPSDIRLFSEMKDSLQRSPYQSLKEWSW